MNNNDKFTLGVFFLLLVAFIVIRTQQPKKPAIIKPPPVIETVAKVKGKVAIVLDDWGYSLNNFDHLSKINTPLTLAVLPKLPYSHYVASRAREIGYQTILHLPLESLSNKAAEKETIYSWMSKDQIRKKLDHLLDDVQGASGVNNHQGSKATQSPRVMSFILADLKERNMFFLDSLTAPGSVCELAARKVGIKFAKRDVFLDLPSTDLKGKALQAYIETRLEKLCDIAIKRGSAIGIGHDRKDTLEVLRSVIPRLKKKGIQFVFVSELAR